jgi:hypothetical protein
VGCRVRGVWVTCGSCSCCLSVARAWWCSGRRSCCGSRIYRRMFASVDSSPSCTPSIFQPVHHAPSSMCLRWFWLVYVSVLLRRSSNITGFWHLSSHSPRMITGGQCSPKIIVNYTNTCPKEKRQDRLSSFGRGLGFLKLVNDDDNDNKNNDDLYYKDQQY